MATNFYLYSVPCVNVFQEIANKRVTDGLLCCHQIHQHLF